MGVALQEHICFQDMLVLIAPDKPSDNFPSILQPHTRGSIPYLQGYRFKLSQVSGNNLDTGTV